MSYHPKQEPTSPSAEPREKESRRTYRRSRDSAGETSPEESKDVERSWLGVWWLRPSDVADRCPAARSLEQKGYRLISHCAPFGTILQYKKGDDWKFVIPSKPKTIMTRKESLIFIRDQWNLRRPSEEEYFQKRILLPLASEI